MSADGIRRWILRRLFGAAWDEEPEPPYLERPIRLIEQVDDLEAFFAHLADALPSGCVLEIHGHCYAADVLAEYRTMQLEPELVLKGGWVVSRLIVFRIPLTQATGRRIAGLLSNHAAAEVANHIYATGPTGGLMDWSDFRGDPAWFAGSLDQGVLERFAEACGGHFVSDANV